VSFGEKETTTLGDSEGPPDPNPDSHATIWQGFHHAWEYNHRLNRLGSYVRQDDEGRTMVGHTAASGTGGDTAHFAEYVTRVRAADVGFQAGHGETTVECMRAVETQFRIPVDDLPLDPALVGRDTYTVVINGFDLIARRHSDKLVSFDLEVTDPTVTADGTSIRFNILGSMCFDCRTAECQLWPIGLEIEDVGRRRRRQAPPPAPDPEPQPRRGIKRHPVLDRAVAWLQRQVVRLTDLENVKRAVIVDDENTQRRRLFRILGKRFFLRLLKWRVATPYVLRVHYLIIGGDADALQVTESEAYQNAYAWDAEREIHHHELGVQQATVQGAPPQTYDVNTLAFKRIAVRAEINREFSARNPIQWGKGLHLLEWDVAMCDIRPKGNRVTAQLDLFYKSWSVAMNEVITLTTWGALRSAGSATLQTRLVLLQFKKATTSGQIELPGKIRWPGGGLNAQHHPRACCERPIPTGGKAQA
jgi:hypothetical protein